MYCINCPILLSKSPEAICSGQICVQVKNSTSLDFDSLTILGHKIPALNAGKTSSHLEFSFLYNYANVAGYVNGRIFGQDMISVCGTGLIIYEEGLFTITVENNGYLSTRVDKIR